MRRGSCSDAAREARGETCREPPLRPDERLGIDGYNVLITIESALPGAFIFRGRDTCDRDLASLHGTYRRVEETRPALTLIGEVLEELGTATIGQAEVEHHQGKVGFGQDLASLGQRSRDDCPVETRIFLENTVQQRRERRIIFDNQCSCHSA